MTSDDEATGSELQALLAKIAATAGDPPEHGLARVAIMRRRRKRHRRGAVAAVMALAVTGIGGGSWLSGQRQGEDDLAVASQTRGATSTAELPDVLEVRCSPDGIEVPVASIRPQSDGLHVLVVNRSDRDVEVRVTSEPVGWDSGYVTFEPGKNDLRQPVAPGVLTVGCQVDGVEDRRRVDLVDEDLLYTPPELACPDEEQGTEQSEELGIDPPDDSHSDAVRVALDGIMDAADEVKPLDGYPDEEFGDPNIEPVVRVARDGDTVAFVSLSADEAEGPWSSATLLEVCEDFLPPDTEEDPPGGPGNEEGEQPGEGSGDEAAG